jgi:hypothetical protein
MKEDDHKEKKRQDDMMAKFWEDDGLYTSFQLR